MSRIWQRPLWLIRCIAVVASVGAGCSHTQTIYESDNAQVIALKKMGVIIFEGATAGKGAIKYELDFSKTDLTPEAWDVMKGLTVDTLKLKGTSFSDADFVRLQDHQVLRILDLTDTKVSDAALRKLVEVGSLSELTLCGTPLTDDGLKALTGLKRLNLLNLMNTQVTDAGLKVLKDLPSLNVLVLSGNRSITDSGMSHLADCAKLSMLGVYNTQVTAVGIAKVKETHPTLMAMGYR